MKFQSPHDDAFPFRYHRHGNYLKGDITRRDKRGIIDSFKERRLEAQKRSA